MAGRADSRLLAPAARCEVGPSPGNPARGRGSALSALLSLSVPCGRLGVGGGDRLLPRLPPCLPRLDSKPSRTASWCPDGPDGRAWGTGQAARRAWQGPGRRAGLWGPPRNPERSPDKCGDKNSRLRSSADLCGPRLAPGRATLPAWPRARPSGHLASSPAQQGDSHGDRVLGDWPAAPLPRLP